VIAPVIATRSSPRPVNASASLRIAAQLKSIRHGYHNIVDILEIANTRLTSAMSIADWFRVSEKVCVFSGASAISRSVVRQWPKENRPLVK
jgi:hypothetical protein